MWFIGDLTNLLGAAWAKLVPTVIALAVYFCFADAILISQCLYYDFINNRGQKLSDVAPSANDPERPLLAREESDASARTSASRRRRRSSHVSTLRRDSLSNIVEEKQPAARAWARNSLSVVLVCAAGAAAWFAAWGTGVWKPTSDDASNGSSAVEVALGAQILGYISAVSYLGARIPQIIKNHRDQSCEGLSLLFFMLSLLGNATYGFGVSTVLSFPRHASNDTLTMCSQILFHSLERNYVVLNLPWLIGSWGTMLEDGVIFWQFHRYKSEEDPACESAAQH